VTFFRNKSPPLVVVAAAAVVVVATATRVTLWEATRRLTYSNSMGGYQEATL
jgi:hypothetical protein